MPDKTPVECTECGMLTPPYFNPCVDCVGKQRAAYFASKPPTAMERFVSVVVGLGFLVWFVFELVTRAYGAISEWTLDAFIERHPYVTIYLVGCGAALLAMLVNVVVASTLRWLTKANIFAANIGKLRPEPSTPWLTRAGKFIGTLLLESALSWLSVVVSTWAILALFLRTFREAVSPVPERVKQIRFPLMNNPTMSPEAVWAHMLALGAVSGAAPLDERRLLAELVEAAREIPKFDENVALGQLKPLGVVESDVLSKVQEKVTEAIGVQTLIDDDA